MRKIFTTIAILTAIFFSISSSAQNKVPAAEASKHYGETITICGTILQDNFIFDAKTKNILLLLGANANEKVTVVVSPETSKKIIGKPKNYYANKNVCVTGRVLEQNGRPEIVVIDEDKIHISVVGGGGGDVKPNDFMRFE